MHHLRNMQIQIYHLASQIIKAHILLGVRNVVTRQTLWARHCYSMLLSISVTQSVVFLLRWEKTPTFVLHFEAPTSHSSRFGFGILSALGNGHGLQFFINLHRTKN